MKNTPDANSPETLSVAEKDSLSIALGTYMTAVAGDERYSPGPAKARELDEFLGAADGHEST